MKATSKERATATRPSVAERLRMALLEVHESFNGDKQLTMHVVTVTEPEKWTAARVKRLRTSLNLSQSPFAKLVGVSPALVENWEQRITSPRGAAARLLGEIERDPTGYVDRYVQRKIA